MSRSLAILGLSLALLPAAGAANPEGHVKLAASSATGTNAATPITITDAGEALFYSSSASGFYRTNGVNAPATIAVTNGVAPGGVFKSLGASDSTYTANRSGQMAFVASYRPTGGASDVYALFYWTGTTMIRVAAHNDPAPSGGLFNFSDYSNVELSLSNRGVLCFVSPTNGGPGEGVYLTTIAADTSTTLRVAGRSESAPGGSFLNDLKMPAANDGGLVVFGASTLSSGTTNLYARQGTGLVSLVQGSASVRDYMINNAGQIAAKTTDSNRSLLLGTAAGLSVIAKSGDPMPGGGKISANGTSAPALSSAGRVAFFASLTTGTADSGAFFSEGGTVRKVANTPVAPNGGGLFTDPYWSSYQPLLSEGGKFYWWARTSGPGLYMGDGDSLLKVIDSGDLLEGSRVTKLLLPPDWGVLTGVPTTRLADQGPVNAAGQVTYFAAMEDTTKNGIFRFTPPPGFGVSPTQEIAVELSSGAPVPNFGQPAIGAVAIGSTLDIVFKVKNVGAAPLGISFASLNSAIQAEFSLVTPPPSTLAGPDGSAQVVVRYTPTTAWNTSAELQIINDDADEGFYRILILATGVSAANDADGDGLNDAAEVEMASLGFNWQVAQPTLVNTFKTKAGTAGLYSQAQMQALNVTSPILARDPATGQFKITLGLQKAADLSSFGPLPVTAPLTTVNGQGNIEIRFSSPDAAGFYRIGATP